MAEYEKGILGGFSGLVGTVVGATFRTVEVMKSRPKKSTKPPKQSQINQRLKFALITRFLAKSQKFIKEGFKPATVHLSPMNEAAKYNLLNAITGVAPNFEIDYSKIAIANGTLRPVSKVVVTVNEAGKLVVTWDKVYDGSFDEFEKPIRDMDTARVYIYSEDTGFSMTAGYGATRISGTLTTWPPSDNAGETMHVWLFFVSADGTLSTTSKYLGSVLSIN